MWTWWQSRACRLWWHVWRNKKFIHSLAGPARRISGCCWITGKLLTFSQCLGIWCLCDYSAFNALTYIMFKPLWGFAFSIGILYRQLRKRQLRPNLKYWKKIGPSVIWTLDLQHAMQLHFNTKQPKTPTPSSRNTEPHNPKPQQLEPQSQTQ